MQPVFEHPWLEGLLPHLLSVAGFLLAVFLIARLMSEKRQPGNTLAWLLVIVLIPYVGVPLYLLLGGRKLRRLAAQKTRLAPTLPGTGPGPAACARSSVALAITAGVGSPPVPGNRVELLTTGEDAYRALASGIRHARQSIHITTFILGRDETGRRIVRLLAARARRGIKVRLLLDSVGCMFVTKGFLKPLLQSGGEVQWFMPVLPFAPRGLANLRSHRKIAVFDHTTAIVGGHNLAREYMGPFRSAKRWTDFGARITGPAAVLLNEVFIADWCFASRQPPETLRAETPHEASTVAAGQGELQVIPSGPDIRGDPLYEGIVAMIQSARASIWIITPYFIPDEVLLRSLVVKARSGCEVNLIVPAKSNHPVTDFARRDFLRQLHHAGAKLYHYMPGMMHSKAVIVDETLALFGSANFDLRSLFVNFEIGVMAYSCADVQAIKAWVRQLLESCQSHRPKPAKRRRFLGNVAEDLSRLIAPLL